MWPVPSSKFLKMARGPKSLATPDLYDVVFGDQSPTITSMISIAEAPIANFYRSRHRLIEILISTCYILTLSTGKGNTKFALLILTSPVE